MAIVQRKRGGRKANIKSISEDEAGRDQGKRRCQGHHTSKIASSASVGAIKDFKDLINRSEKGLTVPK